MTSQPRSLTSRQTGGVVEITPSHPQTCTPSHLHTLTPSPPHTCTHAPPHILTPSPPHTCTLAPPHILTPAPLTPAHLPPLTSSHLPPSHLHTCTPSHPHTHCRQRLEQQLVKMGFEVVYFSPTHAPREVWRTTIAPMCSKDTILFLYISGIQYPYMVIAITSSCL